MNYEQLKRAKEIEKEIARLSGLKEAAKKCLDFYSTCDTDRLSASFEYAQSRGYTKTISLTRGELTSGLTIVIDRYKREIQKLEKEFQNL